MNSTVGTEVKTIKIFGAMLPPAPSSRDVNLGGPLNCVLSLFGAVLPIQNQRWKNSGSKECHNSQPICFK